MTSNLTQAIARLRFIGYGLLLLTLGDWIDLLIPLNFLNPEWEIQTIGGLVERVPVPLIGLLLIFLGGKYEESKPGQRILKLLSWLALLLGIFYLLLVPLGISNTVRINKQNESQISLRVQENMSQIQQVKAAIAQANSPEQLSALLTQLNSAGLTPTIQNSQQVDQVKQQLTTFVAQSEAQLQSEAGKTRSQQRLTLFKKAIKWNLGALISGCLFISIWRTTGWARRSAEAAIK
jgi:hypothetical protein